MIDKPTLASFTPNVRTIAETITQAVVVGTRPC